MEKNNEYIDQTIFDYIKKSGTENCDEVICHETRKEIVNQLSSQRVSTIEWYPFKENASILEIEAGFGAITGKLCDLGKYVAVTEKSLFRSQAISYRYRHRENLEVFTGDIETIRFPDPFDYIILLGELERVGNGTADTAEYVRYMRSILRWLKEDGKLLLAVENRYGIQNWCGRKETYTCVPFDGIAGYPEGGCGRTFHKSQLIEILSAAGLKYTHFFYPMPDYYTVYKIFSDECLPQAEDIEELQDYCSHDKSVLFDETEALKDIVQNGAFPFFANAYFVEASGKSIGIAGERKQVRSIDKAGENKSETFKRMEFNRKFLVMQGNACIGKIDYDSRLIRQVMQIQLDLLGHLKIVCEKYNLKLYLIYGSLLGAVRHGGVTPGDDDIDVAMPRKDYETLLQLADEFQGDYFLQTPWNDGCFYGGYLKLRNKKTTAIQPQNWWIDCCEGIGIDIFPLDNGYRNPVREKWKELRICFYQRLLYAKAYGYFARYMDMPLLVWKFYKYLGKLFPKNRLMDRLNKIMAGGNTDKKAPFGIFAHYMHAGGVRRLDREAFSQTEEIMFENIRIEIPKDYDSVLSHLYGNDYMYYPRPEVKKYRHGFYSSDTPYPEYKKKFSGIFNPLPADKEIVLIGDGTQFEEYFTQFGHKYRPKCIVDISKDHLPDELYGVKVVTLNDIQKRNKDELYLIICSVFYKEMEQYVKEAGFSDYFFYVRDRGWLLLEDPNALLKEIQEKRENGRKI